MIQRCRIGLVIGLFGIMLLGLTGSLFADDTANQANWQTLGDGLQLGQFKAKTASASGGSVITVLRADPDKYTFHVLARSNSEHKANYTARRGEASSRMFPVGASYPQGLEMMSEQTPEQVQANLEKWWQVGGLQYMLSYPELLADAETNRTAADYFRSRVAQMISDPADREKLLPQGVLGVFAHTSDRYVDKLRCRDGSGRR